MVGGAIINLLAFELSSRWPLVMAC